MLHAIFRGPLARTAWAILLALATVVTLVYAFAPLSNPVLGTRFDKLNHLMAFACLGFCGALATTGPRLPQRPAMVIALVALGALIEVVQSFIPHRQSEWLDLLADCFGLAIGHGLAATVAGLWPEPATRPPSD